MATSEVVGQAFLAFVSSTGFILAAEPSISEAIAVKFADSIASASVVGPAEEAFGITASEATVDPSALSAEVVIVANTFRAIVVVDKFGSRPGLLLESASFGFVR